MQKQKGNPNGKRPFAVIFVLFALAVLHVLILHVAHAQQTDRSPGTYGPEFLEPGFKENGSYFDAGFQATVNHYGGNLIISATDVSIPSQGKFGLSFTRTFNSNNLFLPSQTINYQADSPLGEGWVAHYGLLWAAGFPGPGSGTIPHPEFVDSSGARHRFYLHNHLDAQIPIRSPGRRDEWISASMHILLQIDNDTYELLTPDGLKYTLQRLYNEPGHVLRYHYFVPTRISDMYGNTWVIAYEEDVTPYVEHPLVQSVTDGLGRRLDFVYRPGQLGNQRLKEVRFDGKILAEYECEYFQNHAALRWHRTGQGRVTTYTNDFAPPSSVGSIIYRITQIESPTGGVTEIDYALEQIFYQTGQPKYVYAVRSIDKGGHLWEYDYLNTGPSAPANNKFKVHVTSTDFEGTYTYYTYGSSTWTSDLWKVGMLVERLEKFKVGGSWTETRWWIPDLHADLVAFQVSLEPQAPTSNASAAATSRILRETVEQDGFDLTTTYPNNSYDVLNFPRRINRPGNVTEEIEYHHIKSGTGGSNPKYLLGLKQNETKTINGAIVSKTVRHYPSLSALPDSIDFYRDATTFVRVDLRYYTTNGYAGSLRSKSYGGYSVSYEYQNGIVSKVDYPEGPDTIRRVDPDGTIGSETRNGVKKDFTWDNDFRLTGVQAPATDKVVIQYDDRNNTVTMTQGASQTKLTHDAWGRRIKREEKIDSHDAIDTYGSFDAFDRPTLETTRTGATYDLAYDVRGRLRWRRAPGDEHEYEYETDSNGVRTTEILNGSVVIERKVDHLERVTLGATNGHRVDYSYASTNNGIRQTIAFQSGQRQRTIERDFLGNKLSETHPETGTLVYGYTPELWRNRMTRPGLDYTYTYDQRGRIREVKHTGGGVISTADYDSIFGYVSRTTHNGVTVEYDDPDRAGRPRIIKTTIPRALDAPVPTYPYDQWRNGGIPLPGTPGYYPWFEWMAVSGADAYQFELREEATGGLLVTACDEGVVLFRSELRDLRMSFKQLPFSLQQKTTYCFRIRGVKTSGEVGPFSGWVRFMLGGFRLSAAQLPPHVIHDLLTRCITAYTIGGQVMHCPEEDMDPVPIDSVEPPEPVIPTTPEVTFVTHIQYDGQGRVEGIRHPDMDTSWEPATRAGRWQKYTYNAQDGQKTVSYGGWQFTDSGWRVVGNTTYRPTGAVEQMSLSQLDYGLRPTSSSVQVDRSYDGLGRLQSLRVTRDEPVLYNAYNMQYNAWGYLESLQRMDPALTGNLTYLYDDLGRLKSFTVNGATSDYTYDDAGNLTSRTGVTLPGLLSYGLWGTYPAELNLPARSNTSYDAKNQVVGWTYDADGRLQADDEWEYWYTALDQISDVSDGTWFVAQYLYDADGNRVREVYDNRVVYSIRGLNGELISQETHFGWAKFGRLPARNDFIYHTGSVLAEVSYWGHGDARPQYVFRDRLGSPAVELYAAHLPPTYVEYSPYGHQMRTGVIYPVGGRRQIGHEFTGHERDTNTARDYMKARYYDAFYGRFNRPDPAFDFDSENPASFNLYSYVHGNPVNFVDSDGLQSESSVNDDFNPDYADPSVAAPERDARDQAQRMPSPSTPQTQAFAARWWDNMVRTHRTLYSTPGTAIKFLATRASAAFVFAEVTGYQGSLITGLFTGKIFGDLGFLGAGELAVGIGSSIIVHTVTVTVSLECGIVIGSTLEAGTYSLYHAIAD